MKLGYELDDVLLVPMSSQINSRDTPDVSVTVGEQTYRVPIIASPMRGIVGVELIKELGRLGGLGILHRFWHGEEGLSKCIHNLEESNVPFGISTGLNDLNYMHLESGAAALVVDVANGYLDSVVDRVRKMRGFIDMHYPGVLLIAGNVVTYNGVVELAHAGADLVRCGIGSGGLCGTRSVTGVGVPQFTALQNCIPKLSSMFNPRELVNIISDGGINSSGAMAKALACGAKFVMVGSILASTYESDAEDFIYGMASKRVNGGGKSVEGIEIKAPEKTRSLEDLVHEYVYGLKSCMTYMNAKNLDELKWHADWVTVGSGSIRNFL